MLELGCLFGSRPGNPSKVCGLSSSGFATTCILCRMPVPEFYRFFRPTLEILAKGDVLQASQLSKLLADGFSLTEEEKSDLIPSGKRSRVMDRTLWATTYLSQAKLIDRPRKGWCKITQRGRDYLRRAPDVIKPAALEEFPEYVEFKNRSRPLNGQQGKLDQNLLLN